MSETRTGKVVVRRTVDPSTGRTEVRAAVDVGEFLYEVIEALADLQEQPGDQLGRALGDVLNCRAEEIEAAGRIQDERYWAERKREAMDELLSLADVAPDPSVLIGTSEVHAIAVEHAAAAFAPTPPWVAPAQDPWDHVSVGHPFGDEPTERAA